MRSFLSISALLVAAFGVRMVKRRDSDNAGLEEATDDHASGRGEEKTGKGRRFRQQQKQKRKIRLQRRNDRINARITCPVLAALHRNGALISDSDGNVELADLNASLAVGLGVRADLAQFQALGIVGYDNSQKGKDEIRNRCAPTSEEGTLCFGMRLRAIATGTTLDEPFKRWINIFQMNGHQMIEHGISTGIRAGDLNMPPNALDCGGVYPCQARFDQYMGTDKRKKFYLEDIMAMVCKARQVGDRGGEWSFGPDIAPLTLPRPGATDPTETLVRTIPGREWQMKGAMSAMLNAFGRESAKGLYMTMDDMKALFMDGDYPQGWAPRPHGCLVDGCDMPAIVRFNLEVGPCEVDANQPWWQGSGCQVDTGRTCSASSPSCQGTEVCVGGRCLCGRDDQLHAMCFEGGQCRSFPAPFGEEGHRIAANNPEMPGNP